MDHCSLPAISLPLCEECGMPAAVRDVRRMYCTRQGGAHRDAESAQRASSVDKGKNNKIKKNTTAICRRSQLRRLACAPPRAAGAWRRNRSTCASTAGPSLLSEGTPLAPSLASFTSGRFLSHEQIFLNLPPVSLSLALSLLVFFPSRQAAARLVAATETL